MSDQEAKELDIELTHPAEAAGAKTVARLATGSRTLVRRLKEVVTAPEGVKTLRRFSTAEAAAQCEVPLPTFKKKVKNQEYPGGEQNPRNGFRTFSMEDILEIRRIEGRYPIDGECVIMCVANFKGGSAKSTLTNHYAQWEALRGRRVLVVDLDPQASLTSAYGLIPDQDVSDEQTARDFLSGDAESLAPMSTYWPNIDLLPANLGLYSAEFALPQRVGESQEYHSLAVLSEGLEALRDRYDLIVIDTPPALSYLTTNALYAADGVVVPVQAQTVDFSSCAQFLSLLATTVDEFPQPFGQPKEWQFLSFVLTRYSGTDHEAAVKGWLQKIFQEHLVSAPMMATSAIHAAGPEMVSLYEQDQRHPDHDRRMDRRTYRRAIDSLEPVMTELSQRCRMAQNRLANRWEGE